MNGITPLTRAALLGTGRAALPSLPASDTDQELDTLLSQLDHDQPEHSLLAAAGAISLREQVGQLPPQVQPNGESTSYPAEDRPNCSAQAAARLGTILDGRYQDLLPAFLTALDQAGQRLPDVYLPNLLDRAASIPTLRPYVLPVLGQTGRWLAAQHSKWAYAAPEIDTWDGLRQAWRSDNTTHRQALLRQLRHFEPERGRQLLAHTWKAETPSARAWFIRMLDIGLSMADEPFLETALDDRNHTVRRHASELLAALPQSRLCQRMQQNISGVLRWQSRWKRGIKVKFPETISPQLVRDGVILRDGIDAARARSAQLMEMVGAIPLENWTERWAATPEQIVTAALRSRWPRSLVRGFALAAERQRNVAWAAPLLQQDNFGISTIRLVPVLPATQFEALVQQTCADTEPPLTKDTVVVKLVRKWTGPWTPAMVTHWVPLLAAHIRQDTQVEKLEPILRTALRQFARACPPEMTAMVSDGLLPAASGNDIWRIAVQEILSVLYFRRAMHAEIENG